MVLHGYETYGMMLLFSQIARSEWIVEHKEIRMPSKLISMAARWIIVLFLFLTAFKINPGQETAKHNDLMPALQPTPTETTSPQSTPETLPGKEVIPLDKLGKTYPWLPIDKSARPSVYYFYFNLNKPPFDNALVRQAFAAATDRKALVEIAKGFGVKNPEPATTFTPAETLGRDLYDAAGIPFDPSRAKELLAKTGYADASKFPVVTLLIGVSETDVPGYHEKIAETVTGMWQKNLGVKVKVEKVDFKTYEDRIINNPPEIFRAIYYVGNNDPHDFLIIFHFGAKYNFGGFKNLGYDRLIEEAKEINEPAKRQVDYIQAEKILCETETAILPIFHLTISTEK